MKVMVTGHRGYIGSILVKMLLACGHEVRGYDSALFRRCIFAPGGTPAGIPEARKDIRDAAAEDFDGIEAVIHLAGLANEALGDLDPEQTYEINYRGSVHLARMARQAGVQRFLLASSCSNYDQVNGDIADEDTALQPLSVHGWSGVCVERDIAELETASFAPTILRLATAYGLSPVIRFDSVVNNLVAWAAAEGVIFMKSDGTPRRPVVHVEDIASALVAVLDASRGQISGEIFNVGSCDQDFRIGDIAKIVAQVVPGCQLVFAPDAGPDRRTYRVGFDKIRQALDFSPRWELCAGVEQLYRAYCSSGLSKEEFEGPRYHRNCHLRKLRAEGVITPDMRVRNDPPAPSYRSRQIAVMA